MAVAAKHKGKGGAIIRHTSRTDVVASSIANIAALTHILKWTISRSDEPTVRETNAPMWQGGNSSSAPRCIQMIKDQILPGRKVVNYPRQFDNAFSKGMCLAVIQQRRSVHGSHLWHQSKVASSDGSSIGTNLRPQQRTVQTLHPGVSAFTWINITGDVGAAVVHKIFCIVAAALESLLHSRRHIASLDQRGHVVVFHAHRYKLPHFVIPGRHVFVRGIPPGRR